ncbi:FtsX-like permease family protein [Cryptosporangium phraense]|uniref:FtsX-like permease family protein n=1 Tax=Cryptosporangium phraense TaxID=2593070 RepID=A0A545AVA0_9ACTN|nr:FtsX-like permease family protein [Cryptosporangium phraense]TQS45259.1 FtsX-like permease family protein [Cryptosporangium phraense]
MLRLILSDLLTNRRIWLGTLVVSAATATTVAVAASLVETGVRIGGDVGLALGAVSGSVLVFSVVAAVIVLGTVANLTVALQRRDYALWQLVGVLPTRVGRVVSAQLFLVAVVGAVLGCLATAPFLQAFFDFSLKDSSGLGRPRVSFGPVSIASVIVLVTVLVVLGGRRAAGRAGRVSPLESLREPELPGLRMSAWRWVSGIGFALVALAVASSLPGTAVDRLSVPLMLIGALLAAVVSAFGPIVFPRVLAGWTGLVPQSISWYLARNSARHNLSRSSAVISSLTVAIALVGTFYSSTDAASSGTVVLILGGPLLLSLLGAAVAVAMSSRTREREGALIRAAGGTEETLVVAAVWEAVVYVVTASLLGVAVVVGTALIGAWAASAAPRWGLGPVLVTALAGLVLMLVATVIPTALASRRAVPAVLAAE